MITCNLMGGLGNQLFQVFATISYSIKSKNQFKFLNKKTLGGDSCTLRFTFWNTFLSRLKPFLVDSLPNLHIIREIDFKYKELSVIEMLNRDVMIFGYFQSYKYFKESYNTICKIIGIKTMKNNLLNKLDYNNDYFKDTISLHFRIGDYKNLQNYHPLMTKEYYYNALNYIKSKKSDTKFKILYFCENDDIVDVEEKINYLSNHFKEYEFIRGKSDLEDWEQLLLMSCCNHNIIANSSFSWWSAYFNDWEDKIVCYPSVWFGKSVNNDTKDLCPPEWIKIKIN